MKKLLLLMLLLLTVFQGFSQTEGISYQAVILNQETQEIPGVNVQGNVLASSVIGIQFTIVDASGTEEYQEHHTTSTDKYGMINLLIGTGTPTSLNNFTDIDWNGTEKKLIVSINFSGNGNNFTPLSEQNLTYMPQPISEEVSQIIENNTTDLEDEITRATTAESLNATAITAIQAEQKTQDDAIDLNSSKIGITSEQATIIENTSGVNSGDQDISGITTNATAITDETTRATTAENLNTSAISAIQTEQTAQNTAIDLNSSKIGITSEQATIIENTSGVNSGDQDISGITTNATAITTLQTAQTTQDTAIALNTTKTGITTQQASDITTNNAKEGLNTGTTAGQMLYWNGTGWVVVATTVNEGATLQLISGVPTWVGGISPNIPTVTTATGRIWMDRNLGASQVATSSDDVLSWGDLYQWGRGSDGHQLRTSVTTTTLSDTDSPGHGDFIIISVYPYNWLSPENILLWQGVNGTNNPCPTGFRLPTRDEWETEILTWSSQDAVGAVASPLKLPVGGKRGWWGAITQLDIGHYWSRTITSLYSTSIKIESGNTYYLGEGRSNAMSCRCIKN